LVAFEAKLPLYRSQNVQVLGVSIDNTVDLAKWGTDIGLSFSLLGDETGQLSKQCGLYNPATNESAKAVAVVSDGEPVYTEHVTIDPKIIW